jgi:hypothetical protein
VGKVHGRRFGRGRRPVIDPKTGKPKTKRNAHNLQTFDRRLANLEKLTLFKELQAKGVLPKAAVKEVVSTSLVFRDAAESVLVSSRISDLKSQRIVSRPGATPSWGTFGPTQSCCRSSSQNASISPLGLPRSHPLVCLDLTPWSASISPLGSRRVAPSFQLITRPLNHDHLAAIFSSPKTATASRARWSS